MNAHEASYPAADLADVAAKLIAMAELDDRVRTELAADGSLFQGYHPRMEAVHLANADRLERIVAEIGWPTHSLVGAEASRAAWLVLQHAISRPDFLRRGVAWLGRALDDAAVPPLELACLVDRIAFFEGRPQRYGTQFDWDDDGRMSPWTLEDASRVDEYRREVGLEPLGQATERHRRAAAQGADPVLADLDARKREFLRWCRRVGWRG